MNIVSDLKSPGRFSEDIPSSKKRRFSIDMLSTDLLRIIFKYSFPDQSVAMRKGQLVCLRWRRILNDPETLNLLFRKISNFAYGYRMTSRQLVTTANRY